MKRKVIVLTAGLILGLGWALRGHFGHEWGASWAGLLLTLALLAMANRTDWTARLPVLAALGTVGWSIGGIMSYGIIVGYGRSDNFPNVCYGLAMLVVVGFLWGAMGGGFLGLGLESTREKHPDWIALVTRMAACAWISYAVIVEVLGLKMTPPRSEAWAGCLGASIALLHYLYRNGYDQALRVALYTALGSGFGFALGNFLQTAGSSSGIIFNWWNVMEFTLGFCGGAGAAWAVYSSPWPESDLENRTGNWLALLFILPGIPAVNLMMTFKQEKFIEMAEKAGFADPAGYARIQPLLGGVLILMLAVIGCLTWYAWSKEKPANPGRIAFIFLALELLGYLLLSHLLKGVFWGFGGFQLEQYLYWPIAALAMISLFLILRREREPSFGSTSREPFRYWFKAVIIILLVIMVLAFLSLQLHDGLTGAHNRF